jgi:tRNA A37 methylthiotransferase MiaB
MRENSAPAPPKSAQPDSFVKRILLIEPPYYRLFKETYSLTKYPLSLGYLAGTIRERTDWEVMVYNADFCKEDDPLKIHFLTGTGYENYLRNLGSLDCSIWKAIQTTISEYRPSVIGITSKSQNYTSATNVARIAKGIDRDIIVVLGGPHPTLMRGEILGNPDIDICVRGEGEITIVELLKAIENHDRKDTIKGISHRINGKILDNPPREFIGNLDDLCYPHQYAAEVLKDYDQYPRQAFSSIFATRGCPHDCTFCGSRYIWGRRVRFRSPENIVGEINRLRELGTNTIHFDDDTFGINKRFIRELCLAIKSKCPGITWGCEIHVNLVDEENISLMKDAGCESISLGVESGNNQILNEIRKDITIEKALAAADLIKKHDIRLGVFFMVGFPQETEESMNDTMRAMKNIKADSIIFSIFTPYPGTETFDFCKEKGLVKDDFDISLYNHQSPANCFCMNIAPKQLRRVVDEMEQLVNRFERRSAMRALFSKQGIEKIWRRGPLWSFRYILGSIQTRR